VVCRYIGAYVRHWAPKRANWLRTTAFSGSSAIMSLLGVGSVETVGYT
jgi:hypothetical protein